MEHQTGCVGVTADAVGGSRSAGDGVETGVSSTALSRVTSLPVSCWVAAIRFDCDKKLILIETKRIMATPDRDGNRFLRDVRDFIRRYYDEDDPERHLTRIRDHEYEPTRDQFNDIVRQTLLKIAHKYDYHYEITLPDGRLGT